MDIVYTYRKGGQDGIELKYSIRSMVKHTPCSILLVGDRPKWYKGPYIAIANDLPHAAANIIKKLRAGIHALSGDALWCADDHYALQDFDETLPAYYSGTIGNTRFTDSSIRSITRTLPAHWLNGIIHAPLMIYRKHFNAVFPDDLPRLIRTEYINRVMGLDLRPISDLKFREAAPIEYLRQRIQGRPFFSTADSAMTIGMVQLLQELYPIPSPYER